MKTNRYLIVLGSLGACFAPLLCGGARADSVTFDRTPATSAVSQLNEKYGIQIVLKRGIDRNRLVTANIDDADSPDGRLRAISAFAVAMDADFQKVFVVSKAANGASAPVVKVDTNASVTFTDTTVPAEQAIRRVADVDAATVQIYGTLSKDVTLSDMTLSDAEAAAEIAKQTGTQWKVYYALTPLGQGHSGAGRIVDRTNGGQPIVESNYVYYRSSTAPTPPAVSPDTTATTPPPAAAPAAAGTTTAPNAANPNGATPYGFNPYGNNSPYGFNPYGGYGTGGFSTNGGGVQVLPSSPYGGFGGYGSPYGGYGSGSPYGGGYGYGF